ncbi:MAG: HD domain-containing protein [Actinobacteria bacterium]|nr:HD domain-containing protein [Actinomycetota bacterium]
MTGPGDAVQQEGSVKLTEPFYGPKVGEALAFAADVHAGQRRRGKDEPYLSHLLAVAGLVAHYGGDEEQIIAAVLHDAVEDQGGEAMSDEIGARFGTRVQSIVLDCSDSVAPVGVAKADWRVRKEAYLATLTAPDPNGARLVEASDKLSNLRDIVEDFRTEGVASLERFKGGRDGTLWYYQQIEKLLMPQVPQIAPQFARELREMEAIVAADNVPARPAATP